MGIEERTPLHLASVDCYLFLHWLLHRSPFELLKKAPWEFLYLLFLWTSLNYLYKVRNVRTLSLLPISLLHHTSQFFVRLLTITVRERILIEIVSLLFSNFIQKWKSNTIYYFLQAWKRIKTMWFVVKDTLNIRRHRFPSRKFVGANQNAAWTIHENEKYLSNWPTFSKPMRD